MDGGAWWAAVHVVVKSWTWLSDFTFTFYFLALEKEMATHSIVLAWRTPGTGEPGGLPSIGSHRVGYDWSDLGAAAAAVFKVVTWPISGIYSVFLSISCVSKTNILLNFYFSPINLSFYLVVGDLSQKPRYMEENYFSSLATSSWHGNQKESWKDWN